MNPLSHAAARSLIAAHFAARIAPADERKLRLHVSECAACRARYERHRMVAELDPSAPKFEQRLARGLGLSFGAERKAKAPLLLSFAAAAALALCLIVPTRTRLSAGFSSRGSTVPVTGQILIYKTEPGHAPDAVGDHVRATDELAFAYSNPNGFRKLMIFGVDEHRHVYWYHPAWSRAEDNPKAIDISAGAEVRELPEAIRHSLDGQQLSICSIFSNDELSVKAVEQAVRESVKTGCPSGIANSVETVLKVD